MRRSLPFLLVLPLALLAVGCTDTFTSPTVLDGPRILAMPATPLEPVLGDTVTVSPVVYLPADQVANALLEASFCPISLGSAAAFACVDPACERPVTVAADGSATFDPGAEAFACAQSLGLSAGGGGASGAGALPDTVETHLRYRITVPGLVPQEAILRLPLHLVAPTTEPNRPPVIDRVAVGGTRVLTGERLSGIGATEPVELIVRIDPDSLDAIPVAGDASSTRIEEPSLAFFSTAGSFDFAYAFGDAVTMGFHPDPGGAFAELWIVARDGRGGQAAFGPVFLEP